MSGFRYGSGDVTSSKKINDWLRENRFYKDFNGAAANEAVIVIGVVVELEDKLAGRFFGHHFLGGSPDIGFYTTAADGTEDGAVLADEHARAFVAGYGAIGVDDGSEGASLPSTAHANDSSNRSIDISLRGVAVRVNWRKRQVRCIL